MVVETEAATVEPGFTIVIVDSDLKNVFVDLGFVMATEELETEAVKIDPGIVTVELSILILEREMVISELPILFVIQICVGVVPAIIVVTLEITIVVDWPPGVTGVE
ncbi:hypothetical protein N7462_000034 [Penicillium macrosclerotiorum]|uniref:uncharacterized protein n=1 Tax=Penicillium macrosclerotiorum TaxID=303699 RepID=UPI0025495768|nr:uncharacterized protein N7462_000034 [Penicillium macrosclerotiorum]KAJ5698029.1 hypothetical protein N7462_000034 [Penicillium macrosclerotiorum]